MPVVISESPGFNPEMISSFVSVRIPVSTFTSFALPPSITKTLWLLRSGITASVGTSMALLTEDKIKPTFTNWPGNKNPFEFSAIARIFNVLVDLSF